MIGGGGTDRFFGASGIDNVVISAPSASTVSGFTPGIDHLVLRDAFFDLGLNESQGTGAFAPVSASLLSPAGGTFTEPGQRLAYDAATGHLLYAANGSAMAPADIVTLITLTEHPAITAADLFFTI